MTTPNPGRKVRRIIYALVGSAAAVGGIVTTFGGGDDATPAPGDSPTTTTPKGVYYRTCADAKKAGATPLHRGDPGYRVGLDKDADGVACK